MDAQRGGDGLHVGTPASPRGRGGGGAGRAEGKLCRQQLAWRSPCPMSSRPPVGESAVRHRWGGRCAPHAPTPSPPTRALSAHTCHARETHPPGPPRHLAAATGDRRFEMEFEDTIWRRHRLPPGLLVRCDRLKDPESSVYVCLRVRAPSRCSIDCLSISPSPVQAQSRVLAAVGMGMGIECASISDPAISQV